MAPDRTIHGRRRRGRDGRRRFERRRRTERVHIHGSLPEMTLTPSQQQSAIFKLDAGAFVNLQVLAIQPPPTPSYYGP